MAKTKIKKLPKSQIELSVELDTKEFEQYWQPAFDDAASKVVVKGFRPGAAPKELLAGGVDHDKVFDKAVRAAVQMSLHQASTEQGFTLIDQPQVEVLDAKEGVSYKATLTVFPEVKLGNYKKIAAQVFGEKKEVTIADEEINKTLKWVADSRATTVLVARPAATSDLVELDVETMVDGKALAGASFKGDKFVLGESRFIKGFDDQIIGHKEGETFTFSITAPADYWQKHLQNKKIDFSVKLIAVYERQIPKFDDAFAATLGPNFKTVEDVKKSVREGLLQEKKEKESEKLRIKVLDEIAKAAKMELPEVMVQRVLDGMVEDVKRMVPREPNQSEEQFNEDIRKQMRARAEHNVAQNLVMYQIAKEEKLEPSQEELEADAKENGVDLETHYDYSYGRIQNKKVIAFLESQAKA